MDHYTTWYAALAKQDAKDPETDAFYQRCHTTALRVAILLSISQSNSLVVSINHIQSAITYIEQQLPEIKRVTMWSGGSQFEQARAKYINFLQKMTNQITTRRILLKHMGMGAEEFDKLTLTLVQDGTVEVPPTRIGPHSEIAIRLTKPV